MDLGNYMSEDSQSAASEKNASPGHNQPEIVSDHWVKKRTFVPAFEKIPAK